jgi:hypothetical protein
MTSQEFVTWMRGFVAGSNNYNLTPKGWDEVKEKLSAVNDAGIVPIRFGTTTTATTLPSETTVNYITGDSNKNLLHD